MLMMPMATKIAVVPAFFCLPIFATVVSELMLARLF